MAYDIKKLSDRFKKDGFIIVNGFLNSIEIDALDYEVERIIREELSNLDENHVFYEAERNGPIKHLSAPDDYSKPFKDLFNRPENYELIEACVGSSVESLASEVFYKSANVGSPAPYHQDNAYLHLEPADGAVIWIALDDTTIENGAVYFSGGSFELGDLPHYETNVALFSKCLTSPLDLDIYPETPALLKRGDASIHNILTPHRSGSNKTDYNRRGIVLNYKGVDAKVNIDRQKAHADYVSRIK